MILGAAGRVLVSEERPCDANAFAQGQASAPENRWTIFILFPE